MRKAERRAGPGDALRIEAGRKTGEPFLYTEHLVLRPLESEDALEMHELLADPELRRCNCGAHEPSLEDTRGRVGSLIEHGRRHGLGLWAVCEKRTGTVLGVCGLFPFEGRGPEAELTYQLRLPSWCKDRVGEAIRACLRYGFGELGLGRIVAVADPDDPVSARSLGMVEKSGMRYRGTRRVRGRELFLYEATREAGP